MGTPSYSTHAARQLLSFSLDVGIRPIISNAVRYLNSADAPVADVLDSVRFLQMMSDSDSQNLHGNAHYLSTQEMWSRAHEICAGTQTNAENLMRTTLQLAYQCRVSSEDLGLGIPRVPELFGNHVQQELHERCWQQFRDYETRLATQRVGHGISRPTRASAQQRLTEELATIATCGFAGYFLTVAHIVELIKEAGIRVSARGSGAGSLVNHILGISGVDPLQHGLLMERFLSPLRTGLPDIDLDVESARRLEVYDLIFARFGRERTACVSMTDTYRVRHAIRDVGQALGLPSAEVAALAKAFPHIRARNIRAALRDLPELRESSFAQLLLTPQWQLLMDCVEKLDGLPRHRAMHPCGIILSDVTLLDRTSVEPSRQGYPMSQFDKDDVEELGFLKLDVLGVRMQSAIAHAVSEIDRTQKVVVDMSRVPLDDIDTFSLIQSTKTLGCFQIESPGQRELIGKFSPETFDDLIIDISLFRPGPVKSDMVTPFLNARHGYQMPDYIHENLRSVLAETYGVVVFHEQVIRIIAIMTGCSLARADEVRRSLGSIEGQEDIREWFYRTSQIRDYTLDTIERVWLVLRAFASFGFCKAHAAAFAIPTYQSAWLKHHHPAAFFAGVLTHDPGMYPKRLILDDARHFGVSIFPVDINESDEVYRVHMGSDGSVGIRLPLSEIAGITDSEISDVMSHRPYESVIDVMYRAGLSRPVLESLIEIGACDAMHGLSDDCLSVQTGQGILDAALGTQGKAIVQPHQESQLSRRDLLLEVARHKPSQRRRDKTYQQTATLFSAHDVPRVRSYGLAHMSKQEKMQAELSILNLDVSSHVMDFHSAFLKNLRATRSSHLLACRSNQDVVVAGIKVAIQTPPVRSGRRVVFLTLDDGAGPIDVTFFEDVQQDYAATLFSSWLLLVRGHVRRTGARGLSIRATGCWDLLAIEKIWSAEGATAARNAMTPPVIRGEASMQEQAESRSVRPVLVHPSGFRQSPYADVRPAGTHPSSHRHSDGNTG